MDSDDGPVAAGGRNGQTRPPSPVRVGARVPDRAASARTGILVVGLCFAVGFVSRGILDGFGVYVLPMQEAFGAGRSDVVAIYALAMVAAGLSAPVIGWLFDRIGPKPLLSAGVLLVAFGCWLASFATALLQVRLGLGVLVGLGVSALGQTPAAAMVSRWYHRRLATAMAFVGAATGMGMMALTPLAQILVDLWDWRIALRILGGTAMLLLLPVLLMPWRRVMAGEESIMRPVATRGAAPPPPPTDIKGALRRRAFWGLLAVYFWTAYTTLGIAVHLVPLLIETGYAPLFAASVFGMVGMLTPIGTLAWGWTADRIGRHRAVVASYTMTLAGIGCLALLQITQAFWVLAAFVILFGGSLGSRGPVVSSMAAQIFGREHLATIYGSIAVGIGIGAALGAYVNGLLYDLTGSYRWVLLSGAFGCALASSPFLLLADLKRG